MNKHMRKLLEVDTGVHNAQLVDAAQRIYNDGSWKQQRVVMLMPTNGTVPFKVLQAVKNLGSPPNNSCILLGAEGSEVGVAYSSLIEHNILPNPELSKWEYILTLEHDNIPQADGLVRLVMRMEQHPEFSAIGGLYWTKGFGGVPQIWGDVKDPVVNFRPQPPDPNGGLVECCGLGMGFTLFRLSMFKDLRLRRPWFQTKDGFSQDLYFWHDAKKYGFRCAVDCSVKVGHYDKSGNFGLPGKVW